MPPTRVAAAPLGGGGRLRLSRAGVCGSEVQCGFAHLVTLPPGGWRGGQGQLPCGWGTSACTCPSDRPT